MRRGASSTGRRDRLCRKLVRRGGGRTRAPRPTPAAALLILAGCAGPLQTGSGPCELARDPVLLPPEARESSGVEMVGWGSNSVPDVGMPIPPAPAGDGFSPEVPLLWTHNDAGWEPVLFAVGGDGGLLARVEVAGARNADWEDLAAGPCGTSSRCLYIADTGDNLERRADPAIYRVEEPGRGDLAVDPDRAVTVTADRLPVRFPDGPRDVEALALLADGRGLLISKGRNHPVEVYRTPVALADARAGEPLVLDRIQTLTGRPPFLPGYVTGAASSADGSLIAVRTYETLRFYRPDEEGRLEEVDGGLVNLRTLREPQGEAVGFLPGNRIVLTSEAGPGGRRATMAMLACGRSLHEW